MENYEQQLIEEKAYLEKVIGLITRELISSHNNISEKKISLIAARKDMWESTGHSSSDFEKLTEMNQQLREINNQTETYINAAKRIDRLSRMKASPYFGRFDFKEKGYDTSEKIYVGISNLMDPDTHDIYVYDWRASISSIFYQYELGAAAYTAPLGEISGEVSLKRQYNIQNSKLKYFFDCSVRIEDEMLQEVLSHNSSAKMKNIVETIQKEQDIIIRDTENDLLIVQGAAGSGKTSIALHRIAFLLYHGLNSGLTSNNFIIISPNMIFGNYISSVLPELGEEEINQTTFEDIAIEMLKDKAAVQSRAQQLESIIVSQRETSSQLKNASIKFKGTMQFVELLDRYLEYYKRKVIKFEDIYYHGRIFETRQQLKNFFLNNKIDAPIAKRLKRIEAMLLDRIRPFQRENIPKIEKLVQEMDNHEFDIKSFSRLLELKRFHSLMREIKKLTEIDFFQIYYMLFSKKNLLKRLAVGLELPQCIDEIIEKTKSDMEKGCISYEDCAPLIYLKLRLEGVNYISDIKHIVIDEAQDYYPIQYEVFKLMYKDARFTVLGDVNQEIEKNQDESIYDHIIRILDKRKAVKLMLTKSYRSSYEITEFNQKLLGRGQNIIPFERHEAEPDIVKKDNEELLQKALIEDINNYKEKGYEAIAVICKTQEQTVMLYEKLRYKMNIKIVDSSTDEVEKGVILIPSYMAKGLEFDVVLVYDISKENYSTQLDRKLLYIACTRALHRLSLYYCIEKCDLF